MDAPAVLGDWRAPTDPETAPPRRGRHRELRRHLPGRQTRPGRNSTRTPASWQPTDRPDRDTRSSHRRDDRPCADHRPRGTVEPMNHHARAPARAGSRPLGRLSAVLARVRPGAHPRSGGQLENLEGRHARAVAYASARRPRPAGARRLGQPWVDYSLGAPHERTPRSAAHARRLERHSRRALVRRWRRHAVAYQHLRCVTGVLVASGGLGREVSWLLPRSQLPLAEQTMPLIFPRWLATRGTEVNRLLQRHGSGLATARRALAGVLLAR